MSFDALTEKQKRTIESDLETLFSKRALLANPDISSFDGRDLFSRMITYKRRNLFLSDRGQEALRSLTEIIASIGTVSGASSNREIGMEVRRAYESWLTQHLQPDGCEFVEGVRFALAGTTKDYKFLVKVEGIELLDMEMLDLGFAQIHKPDRKFLESVQFGDRLDIDTVYEDFHNSYWLLAGCFGTPDFAREQFEYRTSLAVGVIAICGSLLYEGALTRCCLRAHASPEDACAAVNSLRWEEGGANPSLSRRWATEQDLPLGSEMHAYLRSNCFLDTLTALPTLSCPSQIQGAILRAIYWFGEANRDRNPVMQFVKLWSCIECFFGIDKEGLTERNARGMATLLVYGGYGVVREDEYEDTKRQIKRLYGIRSKILHRGHVQHVRSTQVDKLASWTAWMIVSMAALTQKNYRTLREVREQVDRLDGLHCQFTE